MTTPFIAPPLLDQATSLQVIKRTGATVTFDNAKISVAMAKAFVAVEGQQISGSSRVRDTITDVTQDIIRRLNRRYPSGGRVDIEDIQDLVELGLMRNSFQKVARAYVLYREEHFLRRTEQQPEENSHAFVVLGADGLEHPLDRQVIAQRIQWACTGIEDVDPHQLIQNLQKSLYSGMKLEDVSSAMIMTARVLIDTDPGYSYVCAQLLLDKLWGEVTGSLNISSAYYDDSLYPELFELCIRRCVDHRLLSDTLLGFDLPRLGAALKPEQDRLFGYLGMQTLYDRYFLHWQETRIELPQTFFMRVAMGLAINEDDPNSRAIEFYQLLSSFDYMTSTPTLFNSGSVRSQLSSCYLTSIPDDLEGIYSSLKDNALLSKWSGGLGNDWTQVRALGSRINGTNGQSQGVVPFLKVVNDTAVAVNQGGKRKGAVCAYLETWHLDIEEFLELRKNTGDERRRTHDMNSANWIPDLFMKRVFQDKEWTLFSPDSAPDLHDLYGVEFESRYAYYEQQARNGNIPLHKTLSATQLWRKMLSMLFETGHPWLAFKDPCNIRSPQQHCGVIHSSNLCTEITLNTSAKEIAVCNLGSVNLVNHIRDGKLDQAHLERTVNTAIRMLDNVIDINFYAVEQAKTSNLKHRPIGLGTMGFQDALYALNIPYASIDAVQFADQSMELISYYAIRASSLLAQDRGHYPSYQHSSWDKGLFPIDTLAILAEERGHEYCTFDLTSQLDWQPVRDLVAKHGMRNSNVMAIAPTATISNIVGVSQSIEPTYQNIYAKSNLSGEFTVINQWMVNALKQHDLWDEIMIQDVKYFDGSLKNIARVPDELKERFATAFEIDSRWLIEAAARRQKWIDQAQSLNLYLAEPSGKSLDNLYKLAWSRGLKTTYYLRSLGATQIEKNSDVRDPSTLAASPNDTLVATIPTPIEESAFCSILDPDCEACQ
ncbi:ribonucleoside-diphosphate reductase subunit alpha [Gammaproteobacteria bacterium 45_16_T64]|nr:ribonucleoside-diphosphate reductase subunit alpha [Gammaproteobacteria bacterium 45_16_T64]